LTRDKALRVQEEIEHVCNKYGIWVTVTYEKKPDLKVIKMETSIKVTEAEK
jgi:hypothetical protein